MRSLPLLLILACHADKGGPLPADTASTSPADCGELAEMPSLSADSWSLAGPVPGVGIVSFVQTDDGIVFVGSHNAGLWKSEDEGATWSWVHVEITHTYADLVSPLGHPEQLFRSAGGFLEKSEDEGETWRLIEVGSMDPEQPAQLVNALAAADWSGDRLWTVTSDGSAWASTDNGEHFEVVGQTGASGVKDTKLTYAGWRLLGEAAEGDPLILADQDGILRSEDAGLSWTRTLTAAVAGAALIRDPADPTHLLVGGEGAVYQSTDAGLSWSGLELGGDITAAAFASNAILLLADGSEFTSTNGGTSFARTILEAEAPSAMISLESGRLLMGHDDGLLASTDEGLSWFDSGEGVMDPGMAVLAPHPSCPDRLFTASRCSGGVFRSSNWGQDWEHVNHNFHYVMALLYDPQDPEVVWGVSDDAIMKSTNGGADFEDVVRQYHFHGFAIDPEDGDRILMGSVGSGEYADFAGRVYLSEDGGATATDVSTGIPESEASMHTLLYWPDDPEVVLLGTYKGGDVSHTEGEGIGLYRSTNRGLTWARADLAPTEISWLTEAPGGAVAATGDGLWRTTDAGVSWTRLEGPEGLLLSVDFVGDIGLTIAKEGQLWRTDDGGESWREFDDGLPWDDTTFLASVAIAADASMAWVTVYNNGVYQIAL